MPFGAPIRCPLREPATILTLSAPEVLGLAEQAVDGLGERPLVLELARGVSGALEQSLVATKTDDGDPSNRTGERRGLALAPDLEVAFRELEPVRRGDHRLEPLARTLGELLLHAGDEEAVRLLGASADAPAELMELCEAEPVGLLHDP